VKARQVELADPKLYEDFGKWNALHTEQESWKRDLERLTSRWETLSAELEDVRQKLTALR
jgi:ATP-binding cassette, subfamily F, member 3